MKVNWLWDSRITEKEGKKYLADETHPKYDIYAEKLLSRVSDPEYVFNIIDKKVFCRKWPSLKKRMQRDQWLKTRILFWDTIYRHLIKKFQREGIKIRTASRIRIPVYRKQIANEIKKRRLNLKYRQIDIARKMNVIQQYVSKLEAGSENYSIDTLAQVARALNKKLIVKFQ